MDQDSTNSDAHNALEARLARLEVAVARQPAELRTRRLLIVDEHDIPRIVGEVHSGGMAELRLDAGGESDDNSASVSVFATPGDRPLGAGCGSGLQVWINRNAVDEITAWAELEQ